jgi:thioesterase domain-containing protein
MAECPTPARLAQRLNAELSGLDQQEPADTAPSEFLGGLYAEAARAGRAAEIMDLIRRLAAFRPVFAGDADLDSIPGPVPVSRGPAAPALICVPSFAGWSGAQEYARFARGFRGSRDVSVVPAPGFAAGEPLPASVGALAGLHAGNIRRSVAGAPFVLAGHSSGGLAAHAVATVLDRAGLAPAGIVLIDPYSAGRKEFSIQNWSLLPDAFLADDERQGSDAWLTAMAHYFSLDWAGLETTVLPTLLVRAQEPMGGSQENGDWKSSWTHSSNITVVDVPGNHFTMMTDHADTTNLAVSQWLAEL